MATWDHIQHTQRRAERNRTHPAVNNGTCLRHEPCMHLCSKESRGWEVQAWKLRTDQGVQGRPFVASAARPGETKGDPSVNDAFDLSVARRIPAPRWIQSQTVTTLPYFQRYTREAHHAAPQCRICSCTLLHTLQASARRVWSCVRRAQPTQPAFSFSSVLQLCSIGSSDLHHRHAWRAYISPPKGRRALPTRHCRFRSAGHSVNLPILPQHVPSASGTKSYCISLRALRLLLLPLPQLSGRDVRPEIALLQG